MLAKNWAVEGCIRGPNQRMVYLTILYIFFQNRQTTSKRFSKSSLFSSHTRTNELKQFYEQLLLTILYTDYPPTRHPLWIWLHGWEGEISMKMFYDPEFVHLMSVPEDNMMLSLNFSSAQRWRGEHTMPRKYSIKMRHCYLGPSSITWDSSDSVYAFRGLQFTLLLQASRLWKAETTAITWNCKLAFDYHRLLLLLWDECRKCEHCCCWQKKVSEEERRNGIERELMLKGEDFV